MCFPHLRHRQGAAEEGPRLESVLRLEYSATLRSPRLLGPGESQAVSVYPPSRWCPSGFSSTAGLWEWRSNSISSLRTSSKGRICSPRLKGKRQVLPNAILSRKCALLILIACSLSFQLFSPPKISYGFLPSRIWQFLMGALCHEPSYVGYEVLVDEKDSQKGTPGEKRTSAF